MIAADRLAVDDGMGGTADDVFLRRGLLKDPMVRVLQHRLNRDYPAYSTLKEDGNFGEATESVVKEFQRKSGLEANGIAGPATLTNLRLPTSKTDPRWQDLIGAPPHAAMMAFAAAPDALVVLPPPPDRGHSRYMGVVAGSDVGVEAVAEGPTACIGIGATDLCEIAPSGRVAVAGDTWQGKKAFEGPWTPSVALHVSSLTDKVKFDRKFGWGRLDEKGWHHLYQEGWRDLLDDSGVWGPDIGRPPDLASQLPAGTVRVGKKDYLLVTRTRDLIPQDSRLVEINADGPGWPTVAGSLKPASYENGNQTQISGCEGPDGWVYIVADDFHRRKPIVMYRCRPETFTNRDSWQGWGPVNDGSGKWDWGNRPEPLCRGKFGELSLRIIGNKYVLSVFNDEPAYGGDKRRIEVHVADTADPGAITQILREDNPLPWAIVVDEAEIPCLYGGYIVPGSTLERTRILVSEWLEPGVKNYPYNVREYEVNLS